MTTFERLEEQVRRSQATIDALVQRELEQAAELEHERTRTLAAWFDALRLPWGSA